MLNEGVTSAKELKKRVEKFIRQEKLARIDYAEIVDPETLECLDTIEDKALLALAVKIGVTRLIDNVVLTR
jgi:pantoate--beta-alanine ligase